MPCGDGDWAGWGGGRAAGEGGGGVRGGTPGNDIACVPLLRREDWPSQYLAADRAAQRAQRRHLFLQACNLSCIVLGTVSMAIASVLPEAIVSPIHLAAAAIFAVGLFIPWVSRGLRDDQLWSECRTIAESTKTTVWQFMMRVPPFANDDTAIHSFVDQLRLIRRSRVFASAKFGQHATADARTVTRRMTQVRARSFEERRDFYLRSRVRDQKTWYLSKAKTNSSRSDVLLYVVACLQLIAVLLCVVFSTSPTISTRFVPVLITIAASFIAWSHLRRYRELSYAYSLAAQDIGDQEAILQGASSEQDLVALVEHNETIVSRENTLWSVRGTALSHMQMSNTLA